MKRRTQRREASPLRALACGEDSQELVWTFCIDRGEVDWAARLPFIDICVRHAWKLNGAL